MASTITKEELRELRERAENAIERGVDPWLWDGEELEWEDIGEGDEERMWAYVRQGARLEPTDIVVQTIYEGSEHHAEFIATADPETVLDLICAIERRHEVLQSVLDTVNSGHIDAGEDFILKLSKLVKEVEER